MKDYCCPKCGRFLLASDAPSGYRVRVPRCQGCGERPPVLRFGQDAAAPEGGTAGIARACVPVLGYP